MAIVSSATLVLSLLAFAAAFIPVWKQITPKNNAEGPFHLGGHTALIFDQKFYIFGGFDEDFASNTWTYKNQTWRFDFATKEWKLMAFGPSARAFHTAVMDHGNHKMYMYGGANIPSDFSFIDIYSDLWEYDIDRNVWTQIPELATNPGVRLAATMVLDGHHLYLTAGVNFVNPDPFFLASSSDMWKFDLHTRIWTLLKANMAPGNPPTRFTFFGAPTTNFHNHHKLFVIASGETDSLAGDTHLNDTWVYDITTDAFINVTPANPLNNLHYGIGLSSAVSSGIMVDPHVYPFFGGEGEGGETGCGAPFTTNPQNQTWILNMDTFLYQQLFPVGDLPQALKRNAGDVVDVFYYVYGGYSFHCVDNVGGQIWSPYVFRLKLKDVPDPPEDLI